MKYCPQFPSRFGSAEDGRLFCCGFFDYYNFHHRHSGIGLMTPADVHYGRAEQLTTARRQILLEAQQAHPERFVRGTPQPPVLPPQGLDQPAAGKTEAPRCRTSPSRGGVHTWGTPFSASRNKILIDVDVDRADLTSLPHHNRGSQNAACECLKVVDMFRPVVLRRPIPRFLLQLLGSVLSAVEFLLNRGTNVRLLSQLLPSCPKT